MKIDRKDKLVSYDLSGIFKLKININNWSALRVKCCLKDPHFGLYFLYLLIDFV